MKLSDFFRRSVDLPIDQIAAYLGDSQVRRIWIESLFEEITSINVSVDRLLLKGNVSQSELASLSGKRQAIRWVLEQILSAQDKAHEQVHNLEAEAELLRT